MPLVNPPGLTMRVRVRAGVCALNLYMDMYSLQKLIMMVIIHHIYVWCRVFMAIFSYARVLEAHEYSAR